MTDNQNDKRKCPRCNCWRLPTDFLSKTNREVKQCANCRGYSLKSYLEKKNYLNINKKTNTDV